MSPRPPLPVFLYDRHVADVVDTGFGDTAVRYTADAVADPTGCRLSLSLPVGRGVYPTAGPGGRWVRALLPEGRALAWAVRAFGIPEDDRYGLIAVLGADVAGAVQVLMPGHNPRDEGRYEHLSTDELIALVQRAPEYGLGLDRERGVRLSLAGMQDKVLLHRVAGKFLRPVDGAASTVIVKPEPPAASVSGVPNLDGLATNELMCLELAHACGLSAARASVELFGDTRAIVVERYDRVVRNGHVERVHQEDLLGALGMDPLLKYERPQFERLAPGGGFVDESAVVARPGPSLAQLAELLAKHLGRALLVPFLETLVLNVVIGNADAHARNHSVLLTRAGLIQQAPLYDLISTRYWDALDPEPAQLVNGVDHLDEIGRSDLIDEAASWGLPRSVAARRVDGMLRMIEKRLPDALVSCVDRGGEQVFAESVASLIGERVRALLA